MGDLEGDKQAVDNELRGSAADVVVQAGQIKGDVHISTRARRSRVARPRQLPLDIAHFTDRQAGLVALDNFVREARDSDGGNNPTVVISTGAAGVGKTALAVHWGHVSRPLFPDGDLYADMHGFSMRTPVSPDEALDGFLRALDVPADRIPASVEARAALFRSMLDGKRVLVMLDNVAHVDQVRPLLPASPTCFVIVTSRSRLSGLVIRNGARRVTLDVLTPEESLGLLRQVIGRSRVDAEPQAAARIARHCAYLPLALRIVAERALGRSQLRLIDLATELADEQHRLDSLSVDDDDLSAVRHVFSWSYRALPPEAARLFRLLGIVSSPDLSSAAAAALTAVPVSRARRLLEVLAGLHLIQEPVHDRFRYHDLVRVYAAERAEAEEPEAERTHALRRMLAWYLASAEATARTILPQGRRLEVDLPGGVPPVQSFDDQDEAVAWCEAERTAVVSGVWQARELGQLDLAWKLPVALWGFFELRSYWADWIATCEIGLDAARQLGDRVGEAWILISLGDARREQEQFDQAARCYETSLRLGQETGDRWLEGISLLALGVVHTAIQEFSQAVLFLERAQSILQALGERRGEGMSLLHAGTGYRGLGRHEHAIARYQGALQVFSELGNRWSAGFALYQLGTTYQELERLREAIESYRAALDLFRAEWDTRHEALTLAGLGEALHATGRPAEGHQFLVEAIAILDNIGDPHAPVIRGRLDALR